MSNDIVLVLLNGFGLIKKIKTAGQWILWDIKLCET